MKNGNEYLIIGAVVRSCKVHHLTLAKFPYKFNLKIGKSLVNGLYISFFHPSNPHEIVLMHK